MTGQRAGLIARWVKRRRAKRGDRGATMVEFALISPILFLILFGIIDFGWLLNQQQDVRYGSREGARIAAVASQFSSIKEPQAIVNAICDRMDSSSSDMHVSIRLIDQAGTKPAVGDLAQIQVWKPSVDITGFFADMLGDSVIKSNLTFRLEQPPAWTTGTDAAALATQLTQTGNTVSGGLSCPAT